MPFKKNKNKKKKDPAREKSESEDIEFDCEVTLANICLFKLQVSAPSSYFNFLADARGNEYDG
jgi:hypothetical protein